MGAHVYCGLILLTITGRRIWVQFWEAGTATGKAMHDIAQIWAGGEGDLFHWAAPSGLRKEVS